MKAALRRLFCASRPISWRRLAAFVVATVLLLAGYISEQAWVVLAVAYVGGEVAQRLAATAYGTSAPASSAEPEDAHVS